MKRIALFLTVALAVLSTIGGNNSANAYTMNPSGATQVQDTMVLGKLYFVNLKEGEKPVMTGLSLFGNRCGTEEFNSKPCSDEGIRSVFELYEWIEFHPQASAVSSIKLMVFKHKVDQFFYQKNVLNDETPDYVQALELNRDPEAEESEHWGSFYLDPEEVEPGYYDFVFVYNNKSFATMVTRFYKPEEIYEKPDSELEELMTLPISK